MKLLWLALCNIEDKRARADEKETRRQPRNQKQKPKDDSSRTQAIQICVTT